uniref:Auxin transport protein BIG-like n=1 Tax=Nicotiana tabacum TaxID=4097 RepID=A0A1S3XHF8_TOBAC|nr:PREDICTED: auxin transport protein BIG-like [Nicotiana tabacum]
MAEIAKLVDVFSSGDDLSQRLRADSSLNLGFRKLCSILRQAVEPVAGDGNKLGLQFWDQSQIQAVTSLALTLVNSTRSLSVERVEPVIVAAIQLSVEFALCYLEKWICNSDDSMLQSYILQLLEIALVDETDKELDLLQPCSSNASMDMLPIAVIEDNCSKWQDGTRCMLQGGRCSKEEKAADTLLMTLASEWMHPDNVNTTTLRQSVPYDCNKLINVSQHWAVVHLECVHRLVTICKDLLRLPAPSDEKSAIPNLRKRFSFCVKVFKLLGSLTKNSSYTHFDAKLFRSVASFTEVLPTLFKLPFDFVSGYPAVESGLDSQVMLLLEEFIQIVQTIFCNTNVFQNIQACIAALILDHLDPDVWKYSSAVNPRPPLAYCPRVVVYVLKLILDVRNRTYQLFEYKGLDVEGVSTSQLLEPPLCQVHSAKVNLLKKYSVEELLRIIFSPSVQWVDNVMQLLLFLHSEGVKLKPKLERSCSSVTKTSVTSESENTACHEDEALFGDLFSEGGRSAGSVDGYDQPAVAHSSNTSSTPIQAATELLSFLNDCILSPEWCGPVYEDGCRKFTSYHIDILLSVLSSEGCDAEATGHDAGIALNEQMKLGYRHLSEICLDLFHNLLSRHALSDRVEETLVEKILVIENGAFLYNDLTLGLLAHAVVCLVDSAGSSLRTKMYNIFADFVCEKAKTICSKCPNLDELLGILPSLFHVEILLMAFHLSSEDEKAVQANVVFSALKAVAVPSAGFDSTQLSCWALLVSRLIVMLRHMLFYPLVCPSSLLLEFRTKLREASSSRLRPRVSGSRASSWVSILFEGVMGGFIKETPTCNALLSHLIDITPLPPSACRDDPTIECLGLSWNDICASFSRILRFWEGKKPEKVEDLILERYIFVLCWDLPVVKSTSEHLHRWLTSAEVPELSNAEHFVYFSQLFSGDMGKINYSHLSVMLMDLIHRLHDLHVSEDVGEFGWDFLRAGSWLSLSLSLVTAGTAGHCMDKALASAVPMLPEQTSRDGKFYAFTEGVISTLVGTNQVERLIRVLSSLLKRYLQVYQKALIMTIDGDQFSPNRLSPTMSFVHAGFDKCKQDELLEKMGSDPCQYKPLYGTLSRLDTALDKLSLGSHSKILWESLLHGFPCLLQPPSGTLLSSILNVAGVVNCIDGLMKVIDAGGVLYLETQAISQILELVCRIKCDSIFEDLHGKCNAIYQRLTEGSGGVDYSSLFVLKHMEEFLRCVNERDGGDTSGIYEALIVKVIDIVDSLKREPSGTGVLKYFLSLEDGSKQIKDLYGSQRGDLLVLVDALDGCNSEQVSIRVLNFFVDLLSGDMYAHVKEKLQKKFLHMDMVYLSKWLETRLLGSVTEESSGVACATGASVSLRESTMNFITCLLSPSSGILSQELHKHLVKSMLISLDKAFLLFEFTVAKCYFNFLVQLSGGENLIKQLMRQTMLLTEKLADDENLLQGLKYLFGFFASVLSDCCSAKSATERSLVKSIPSSSSAVGSAPTRSICSRKNADAVVLSSSQGVSAIECDATSVDEDEDDGTSDGENGSLDKDEEEDNNSERALASKVCTFTSSGSNFMEQHWYFCYTCDLTVSKGCCSVCAKVCHRGHRVVYSRSSRFFCDCGAGGVRGSNCQCLKPRKFAGSNNAASRGASNFQSFLPFTENGDQLPDSDSDIDEDVLVEADNSIKMSIPKDLQDGMPILLDELDLESCVVRLCSSLLPSITSRRDSSLSRERKIFLGNEKVLCNSVDLLQLKKAYKSGSLDLKIKADYSNAKELKSHLASGSLVKSLLSVSTRGRLAVGEGDKVAIFDVGQLIGQATVAPVTADKTNVKPLSKNVVRFEIVNLIFNPLVENYLAVAGYEDCQVLTVNHRGEVSDRLAIELALQGAYIKHVDWVPGSQVQLMVVTNKFVKIYDLSLDNISPVHYFTLPDGMIMDAALIVASQGRMFLIVLSEHGSLYRLELSTKGNVGAKPLKEIMQIEGKERHAKGSSLYFSSMHRLLFLSLQDGTTLVGRVNPDATSLTEVSAILENETDSKHRPAGLHRWRDLFGGSALFVSFSSLNSNAACAVSFGEHQVLVQNLRHSVGSASPVVGVATYKPLSKDKIHCLVLHEDGSLQIYSHVPAGVDSGVSAISDKVKKLGPGILNNKAYGGTKPEFPLDFFEKTVCITQDVKLSSDAIRNGDSELAKQTLASEDGFLESPNPGGFKITVSNSNPDLVMVGLRLHVGNTSANHIPSEITVFQRVIKLDEGMRSWYDIAFTVAESLLADEEFTVSVGPTFSGAALPRIDSLEIYGRAKDEFGWKEKMDAVLDMEARVLGCNSWPAGSRRKCRATQSAPLQELVVAAGLKLLSRIYSLCKPKGCSKVEEAKVELSKLRCKPLLEVIFESDREPLLQAAANRVLQAVFPKREIYYQFGEVTILVLMFFTLMLRNWHQPGTDGSATKSGGVTEAHDKAALHISPSTCVAASPTLDGQEKIDFISHLLRACSYLRQQAFVNYLMNILQELTQVFKSPPISTDASSGLNTASGCGALLTIRREVPAGNFSPFFSDSYAKSHRADIFVDYHRLLLENTFRLLYSLIRPEKHDKAGEKEKIHKMTSGKDLKLDGYQDVLCSYINNPNTSYVRRYARRLFLHLCGSKTHYYSVRDSWQFSTEVKKLYKHINKSGGFQSSISYERSVKIVRCLTTMAEVAAARPRNWQKYCLRHGDLLPFLLNGIFYFGEECVIQALKLLNLAFYTGKDSTHSSQKAEVAEAGTTVSKLGSQAPEYKKKKKGEDSESGVEKTQLDMEAVVDVFIGKGGDVLKQFIDCFLLEWNSSSVRSESKSVLLGVWHHGNPAFRETLLTALLEKVKSLPMYGQNIIEYTELVTFLLGKVPDHGAKLQSAEVVDKCLTADVINCIFETLHSQNELLANHPNSRIYNTLSGLVEFDGYYLESEPCVACSSPEVPYSRMKLESLKSETKFTDNRIIVKCTGSYTIQSVAMNVHDARKSKSVKVLNLYYNNRPVADLSELKNNWSLWKRAKSCHLAFNQTELKVDFAIPITACNFMIELDSFYENLQALSLEPLQCPRCSRAVTDKHGICNNCHENAYQCRQCRNINYENLDSFLCNECGYSKYGRFEFNFMAKPSFTFDSMENEEDMKRGLTAIEAESENAHRRYQQLLGFKKPLLKIVSSVGENEMDSQQKDSVQQMMVSLPGPSCKINRKIALLGVLYGEKCKAAFDSVSKSVQTLQGLRRVLMNYLHQKQSDNVGPASRFVVSRVPNSCYGCASTFVTQCLEILQVLSKNPASKKQLVAAGVLSELFENNIHQGPKTARVQARGALCAFSEGDTNAVAELNSLIQKKVMYCLEHHRSMDIALATREELSLLSDVCSLSDEFWESRLRVVFQLLFASIKVGAKHPAISEHVILPCLRIISQACTPPKPDGVDKEQGAGKSSHVTQVKDDSSNVSGSNSLVSGGSKSMSESSEKSWNGSQKAQDIQLLSYSEWEKGASYLDFVRRQYKVSQAGKSGQRSRLQRQDYLALKYLLKWKRRVSKTARNEISSFELGSWVTELILSACSQSIRSEMCMLISLLCGQSSSRQFRLLNLLMSLLSATLAAGENAAEYFELLFKMIDTEDARLFLTVRSCLTTICKLITQELVNVEKLERSLHVDISQGFILHKLIELLGKFLEVPSIRSRFMREHLLSEVLEALIVIRGLVVQKTKLINDCNRLLKDLLDSLLLESNENKRQFIQACISGLQIHRDENRGRTSLFILEQLCNLISPSKPEPVYLLILNKAHTQEEFIRGSMTKNPYSSAEIGPLMRDVKNKICQQLDLLGLIEDDYGMELLVAGNIISLDLSIAQVFEQVWKKSSSQSASVVAAATSLSSSAAVSGRDCPPMTVTYRLQGLDGEATEPMIKEIDEDREETQDPEVEFAIAGAVRECGGLEILLKSTVEWASGLKLPSIPLILSMLRGLSMGHLATQKCIDEGGILPLLHALEGVSGENEIGARAENLLDTLSDKEGKGDGFLAEKVHQLRHATRDEMRRRALRKRTELLQGLGMRQELSPDGGERIVVARPVLKGLEDVEDEDEEGLACMVCREGYRLRPTDLLGVYTYSKRVNLGIGSSGNARGDCVYTTVSHFNIIHFQCHQEAKRADAALKNPKKEWDGAALRNNETLCNNLFPVRGPSVPMGQYIRYVDQYWDYLNALGRADGSRLRLLTYDIVLMLARFATGASFSADCRGGGKESNARFLPFMMQMARHLLDHDSSQRHIMIKSISTYLSSPASESRASTTAGTQTSAGTEETVQFMMVTSLLSESYESWLQHRSSFLQRGIYHAYIQRTHGRPVPRSSRNLSGALKPESGSTSASASEAGGSVELFSTIHPMLVYTGLIEQMQRFFKVKKLSSVTILRTQGTSKNVEEDDESRKLEGWEVVMKDRFLNVKEMADFSSKLLSWLDDMTSATNFQEAFDILGVLGDVLSGFSRCEDYVHAAISGGKN